jgi:RimJ/RimL family protein N-acetyltransferase
MNSNLFTGTLVRLAAEDPQNIAKAYVQWSRDSELSRQQSSGVSYLLSSNFAQGLIEKWSDKENLRSFTFVIRLLDTDQFIGDIGIDIVSWGSGEGFVGIGLGERANWNKGYGTDAMRIILRYAFMELNLSRVSLNTFEYNPRAIRSYEKAGFVREGWLRKYLDRDGQRWGILFMGILRDEWLAMDKT